MKFKTILHAYFNKWWPAPLAALVSWLGLALFGLLLIDYPTVSNVPSLVMFFAFIASVLGMIAVGIGQFARKRWRLGLVQVALLPVAGGLFLGVMAMVVMASFFGPSEDGFADHLTIPTDIEIAEPAEYEYMFSDQSSAIMSDDLTGDLIEGQAPRPQVAWQELDPLQANLMAAMGSPGTDDATVTTDVKALAMLYQQHPTLLKQWLAAHPAWRVFDERGNHFATRRLFKQGRWDMSLHGYYSNFGSAKWPKEPTYQFRLTLGFSGEPWYSRRDKDTNFKPGQTQQMSLSISNQSQESRLVFDVADDLVVEVFEQSETRERRLTKAALSILKMSWHHCLPAPNGRRFVNFCLRVPPARPAFAGAHWKGWHL